MCWKLFTEFDVLQSPEGSHKGQRKGWTIMGDEDESMVLQG